LVAVENAIAARVTRVAFAVALAVAGCSDDASGPRYSADALDAGVAVEVDDPGDVIDSAVVFLPDTLTSYESMHAQLARLGVAILQPGEDGHDAIVLYRTGPYCGLLPAVSAGGGDGRIEIDVRSRSSGDCDAMEYDEAIGLQLAEGHESDVVEANHHGNG
jgi:hypothetical protein